MQEARQGSSERAIIQALRLGDVKKALQCLVPLLSLPRGRPPSPVSRSTRLVPSPRPLGPIRRRSFLRIWSCRPLLRFGLVQPPACSATRRFYSSSVFVRSRGHSVRPSRRRLTCWRVAARPRSFSRSSRVVCPSPCRNPGVVSVPCVVVTPSGVWLPSVSAWVERTTYRPTSRAGTTGLVVPVGWRWLHTLSVM